MNYSAFLASTTLAQAGSSTPTAPAAPASGTGAAPGTDAAAPQQQSPGMGMFIIIPIAFGGIILMNWLSTRKQKKKEAEMLARLQKGAKVTTISQARGRVVELDDKEVTLQFEDCRVKFLRTAIQSVDEVPA